MDHRVVRMPEGIAIPTWTWPRDGSNADACHLCSAAIGFYLREACHSFSNMIQETSWPRDPQVIDRAWRMHHLWCRSLLWGMDIGTCCSEQGPSSGQACHSEVAWHQNLGCIFDGSSWCWERWKHRWDNTTIWHPLWRQRSHPVHYLQPCIASWHQHGADAFDAVDIVRTSQAL